MPRARTLYHLLVMGVLLLTIALPWKHSATEQYQVDALTIRDGIENIMLHDAGRKSSYGGSLARFGISGSDLKQLRVGTHIPCWILQRKGLFEKKAQEYVRCNAPRTLSK